MGITAFQIISKIYASTKQKAWIIKIPGTRRADTSSGAFRRAGEKNKDKIRYLEYSCIRNGLESPVICWAVKKRLSKIQSNLWVINW